MRKIRPNLKAFTILEIVITLAITSIILGLIYFIYGSFTQQMQIMKSYNDQINQYSLFRLTFYNDIHHSNYFKYSDNTVSMHFLDRTVVSYHFNDSLIIRKTTSSEDTFQMLVNNIEFKTYQDFNVHQVSGVYVLQVEVYGQKFENTFFLNEGIFDKINEHFNNEY